MVAPSALEELTASNPANKRPATVGFALTRPAFTVNDAMAEVGGTFASVNNAAAHLVEKRILIIAKGSQRNRLFQAHEVLDAFEHLRARHGRQTRKVPDAGDWRKASDESPERSGDRPPPFRSPPQGVRKHACRAIKRAHVGGSCIFDNFFPCGSEPPFNPIDLICGGSCRMAPQSEPQSI